MGKIKRQRRKLHPPSARSEEYGDSGQDNAADMGLLQPNVLFPTKGLFSEGTEGGTAPQQITDPREEDDRMSFVSKKSVKGDKQMSKVEKRKLRHDRWLEKIDTINTTKRREQDAKKRSEAPVTGDMLPLHDALPELSEILRLGSDAQKKTRNEPSQKPRSTLKSKDRQKLMLEETARFQEVLNHSSFKKNPFATINEHLKNKIAQEQKELS